MITDRLRFTVIEANTNTILTRDLVVTEPAIMVNLSGPSHMELKLSPVEQYQSAAGIDFKSWGQIIVCEVEINYVRRVLAYGIISENPKVDVDSGMLLIECLGPMGYPKGEPWLENFNPIAVDPFEVVQRVWAFLQSFSNANLDIEVTPASSGTQMLPGYGYDGSILSFDFFAMFIRAVDFPDCGDVITGLARDIPFDMYEEAWWNEDRSELHRQIRMEYPFGGLQQDYLVFRGGENVIAAELAEEAPVVPASDIIIRSWVPGKTYSSQISNADQTRFRRTIMEEDVNIDSTERAAAWAKRKLQRRNIPTSFQKIVVLTDHPNAPFGSYNVGDSIYVQYPEYPWKGDIRQWHKIIHIAYSETESLVELGLMVEGAFNYDPITYDPNYDQQPTEDPNRLANGYFETNTNGWISQRGQWFRVATITYDSNIQPNAGSVRIDHDDEGERFLSHKVYCEPGETLSLMAAVRWQETDSGPTDAMQLVAYTYLNGSPVDSFVVDEYVNPTGAHGWELLIDDWTVPIGVNEVALQFNITEGVDGGLSYWTYARVIPA